MVYDQGGMEETEVLRTLRRLLRRSQPVQSTESWRQFIATDY